MDRAATAYTMLESKNHLQNEAAIDRCHLSASLVTEHCASFSVAEYSVSQVCVQF